VYEGELKDGKFHGQVKMTYVHGAVYEGECEEGKGNKRLNEF